MKRISRPRHITNLALNYQKTKDQNLLRQLLQTLLSQYVTNGFQLNGSPLSLQDISFRYNVPIDMVYQEIKSISQTVTGFINTENLLTAHEGLLAMTLESVIRDKGLAAAQMNRLLGSQGDTYKPFISAEVNQAIKTTLQATKNLIDLSNSFIPKNTELVNIIAESKQANQLSVQEASELIREGQKRDKPQGKLLSQSVSDNLYKTHALGDMPDVRANPSEEAKNMVNVKAAKLIESGETEIGLDENFIKDVETEWESL